MDFSKNDLSKVKIGDKIWDILLQEWKTVSKVNPNSNWPIELKNGCCCSFGGFTLNMVYFPRYYLDVIEFDIPTYKTMK